MTNKYIGELLDDRCCEIEEFYNKIKSLIENKKILLYKHIDGGDEELLQGDSDNCTEFFKSVYDKDSMPNRIFNEILASEECIKKISLIWHEEKFSNKELAQFFKKATSVICQIDKKTQIACIFRNKRWKKMKIHIFELS